MQDKSWSRDLNCSAAEASQSPYGHVAGAVGEFAAAMRTFESVHRSASHQTVELGVNAGVAIFAPVGTASCNTGCEIGGKPGVADTNL